MRRRTLEYLSLVSGPAGASSCGSPHLPLHSPPPLVSGVRAEGVLGNAGGGGRGGRRERGGGGGIRVTKIGY